MNKTHPSVSFNSSKTKFFTVNWSKQKCLKRKRSPLIILDRKHHPCWYLILTWNDMITIDHSCNKAVLKLNSNIFSARPISGVEHKKDSWSAFRTLWSIYHCVKSVRTISLRIPSECGKILRTRITPNTDTFYAVYDGTYYRKKLTAKSWLLTVFAKNLHHRCFAES